MTLKEAGELCVSQQKKIDRVKDELRYLNDAIAYHECGVCRLRVEIMTGIQEALAEHLKHLEYVMEKEIGE